MSTLREFEYSCSTNTIWTSFDFGTVMAVDSQRARQLAKAEIEESLEKVRLALEHCDNTAGMTIEMNLDNLEVKLKH